LGPSHGFGFFSEFEAGSAEEIVKVGLGNVCMNEADIRQQWEKAYFRQNADAAVGRLFRGLIHNLNGIVQAFSMQSELFAMTFPQLEKLLAEETAAPGDDFRQRIEQVRATLENRRRLSEQMREKVQSAQDILYRTRLLTALTEKEAGYSVAALIRTELDFRQADMFFKHRIEKRLNLAEDLPFVRRLGLELHQMVFALLANAAEALKEEVEKPCVLIEAMRKEGSLHIGVEDNGPGIASADLPRIFEPFFTTKTDHDGLGLYLVKKVLAGCGGQVHCSSRPGSTRFELVIPEENI
jgi:signal transduction histidine kinase